MKADTTSNYTTPQAEHRCRRRPPLAATIVFCLIHAIMTGVAVGQTLTHGPVVGGVAANNAKVFVRTDRAASVALRYSTAPNLWPSQVSETFQTSSANDFTQIIPLSGLTAETTYHLDVIVNGVPAALSPYASFTTFPNRGTARNFKFAVVSDFLPTSKLTRSVQTFGSVAAEQPAFVFIGGDFDHRGPKTLSSKRKMFKDLYNVNTPYWGDFVNLILRRSPIVHQWDDHDAGPNNLDKNYPNWNLSQQVFEEYVPTYPLPSVSPGIWQKFRYAQADFFVLDCRSQRDPALDPDDANKSMLDGNVLGATGQLNWLKGRLKASTAQWKVIFTSLIINPTSKADDGWAAFQTEWNALRMFIETNKIQGVVFISGDLHLGAIDNGVHAGFPEMCVPTANSTTISTGPVGKWSEGYYASQGYGLVTISQNPDRLDLQVKDEYGNIRNSYAVLRGSSAPTPTSSAKLK